MAEAFIKDLKQQIKDRSFYQVYLLTGDEGYMIHLAKHMLLHALVPEGDTMNYHTFDSDTFDYQEIVGLAATYPFFSEKRVILLDDAGILKAGTNEFKDLLSDLPETTCFIIIEEKADKRSSLYKQIKKKGYIVDAQKKDLKEQDMMRHAAGRLKNAGKKIRKKDALALVRLTGKDLYRLTREVDKLISYVGEAEEITMQDIDSLVSVRTEDRIFDLVEAIASGDKKMVQYAYREMIILREPPLRILYMMIRQYRILLIVYDMMKKGMPDRRISEVSGVRYYLNKTKALLKGYDEDKLMRILDLCLETEEEIKTGLTDERIGLEALLVRLTDRI